MGWSDSFSVALIVALGVLLVSAGVEDARIREIANWKNAVIALLAPAWWWALGMTVWPDMAIQLVLGAGVLIVFAGVFACGWMGGGDVKLIAALALWLPFDALLSMLMLMSILGGALTIVMMIERAVRRPVAPIEVPYGVAIAAAALLILPRTEF